MYTIETTIGNVYLVGRIEDFTIHRIAIHTDVEIKNDQGQTVEVPAEMLKSVYRFAPNGEKIYHYINLENGENVPTEPQS